MALITSVNLAALRVSRRFVVGSDGERDGIINEKMFVNLKDHLITAAQETEAEEVSERKEKKKIVIH